ncbi:MAG: HAMP domain-containing histidine kinase [Devosiaceae bacterium]|nr:HAMP domain-containing histidine kinase [Devosiaceae bacterium]
MTSVSLRLKLFATSAATILFALVLAGIAISALFSDHVKRNLTNDLQDQFIRLVAQLDPTIEIPTLKSPMANPSFSTPYGGYYWQVTDPASGVQSRSRSMWDAVFELPDLNVLDGRAHTIELIDPEGTPAIAWVQRLQFDLEGGGARTLDVIVAQDLVHFDIAIAKFRNDLFVFLAILALALFITAWIQISLGLSPFKSIRAEINAIRTGEANRMDKKHPPEVMPIVHEMNKMLKNQEQSITFARTRASNLAHSLKTHLSVMQSESEKLRTSGQIEHADAIEKLGQDMHSIIDHQLRLSRLKTRTSADFLSTPLRSSVQKVVNALQRTPEGKNLSWHIDIDAPIHVDIDSSDLVELLGILLENAANWAKANVNIYATKHDQAITLNISDDGPGLTSAQTEQLGKRGTRLDQQGTGTGIGISIAKEIVAMNKGKISFNTKAGNGLYVEVTLPEVS